MRLDSGLKHFSIFRTPTHADKYLNFNRYHHIEHTNSVIRSLINKANVICNPQHVNEEISYVNKVLNLNGYNNNMIDKISNQIEHPSINSNEPNDFNYVSASYIRGTSERTARILTKTYN